MLQDNFGSGKRNNGRYRAAQARSSPVTLSRPSAPISEVHITLRRTLLRTSNQSSIRMATREQSPHTTDATASGAILFARVSADESLTSVLGTRRWWQHSCLHLPCCSRIVPSPNLRG